MAKSPKLNKEVIGQINFQPVTNPTFISLQEYQVTIEGNTIKITKDNNSISMPIEKVYQIMITEQFTKQLFNNEFNRR